MSEGKAYVDPTAMAVHNALLREPGYAKRAIGVGDRVEYNGWEWTVTSINRLDGHVRLEWTARAKNGGMSSRGCGPLPIADMVAHPTFRCLSMGEDAYRRLCAAIDPLRKRTVAAIAVPNLEER